MAVLCTARAVETRIRRRIASTDIIRCRNTPVRVPYSIRIASGIRRRYSVYLFKKASQKRFKRYPGKFSVFSGDHPEINPGGFRPASGIRIRNGGKGSSGHPGNHGRSVKSRRDFPDTRKGKLWDIPGPGGIPVQAKREGTPGGIPSERKKL